MSKTKLFDDDDDLRGSRGTIDPSCSNIPVPVILHSCDLLPLACQVKKENEGGGLGLGLWCLMPLSTTFQLYHGSQFY